MEVPGALIFEVKGTEMEDHARGEGDETNPVPPRVGVKAEGANEEILAWREVADLSWEKPSRISAHLSLPGVQIVGVLYQQTAEGSPIC